MSLPLGAVAQLTLICCTGGHNVDSPHSLLGPNHDNPHRPNATLLMGSAKNQHDGSTFDKRVVEVDPTLYPRLQNKEILLLMVQF